MTKRSKWFLNRRGDYSYKGYKILVDGNTRYIEKQGVIVASGFKTYHEAMKYFESFLDV